jgi:hypothetical protein
MVSLHFELLDLYRLRHIIKVAHGSPLQERTHCPTCEVAAKLDAAIKDNAGSKAFYTHPQC